MGYLYALLGALLFGANGSLTKLILASGLTPAQLTLFRNLGTAVLAGVVLLLTDRAAFRVRPRQLLALAVLGVVGVALLQVAYAAALHLLPVGITLLLEYLAVLFVAVIAFAVFRERVKRRLWIAIGCVLAGLAVVAQVWDSRLDPLGVLFALGAAAALTLYFVVGERQATATSPMAVAFWTSSFAAAFWMLFSGWWELQPGVFLAPVGLGGAYGGFELPLWAPLVVTVVAGSFLAFVCSFNALRRLTATTAGIVGSSEVLFAFAVAWLWLGEGLAPAQLAGAVVVLAGIVLAQTARATKTVVEADLAIIPKPADDDAVAPAPDVGGRT